MSGSPGETRLVADLASSSLSFFWFPYPEADESKAPIDGAENADVAWVIAPKVDKPETLHFMLRLTDKGRPALSRYKRVIVTVTP